MIRVERLVYHAVLDRFSNMRSPYARRIVQIRDGAGHAPEAIEPSSGESQTACGSLDEGQALRVESGVAPEPRSAEVRVGCGSLAAVAGGLAGTCAAHPLAHRGRGLGGDIVGKNLKWKALHAHRKVDPVAQGARQPIVVATDIGRAAPTAVERLAGVTTRTGVHRGDQQEAGRELHRTQGARDSDDPVLDGFPQGFQCTPVELHDLVEEQDAVVGETDLAGSRVAASVGTANGCDFRSPELGVSLSTSCR